MQNIHFCPLKGVDIYIKKRWLKFGPRSCWMTPSPVGFFFVFLPFPYLPGRLKILHLNQGPLEKWTVHSNNSHLMKFPSRPQGSMAYLENLWPGLYHCPLKFFIFFTVTIEYAKWDLIDKYSSLCDGA